MTTAPAVPGRNPTTTVLHLGIGGIGALAFVLAFFTRYGDFSGSNILVGLLALVPFVKPRAVSAWVLVAVAGAYVLSALTSLFSFDLGGRGAVYWVTFVLLVLQLGASVVAGLVESGIVATTPKSAVPPYGYGGQPGYGDPSQGPGAATTGYGTTGYAPPAYGQQQPGGYTAPSPGYAPPPAPGAPPSQQWSPPPPR